MSPLTDKPMARASAHLAAGRWAEAVGAFRAVLHIDPGEYRAHLGIADATAARGDRDGAIEALVRAAEEYGQSANPEAALALYGRVLVLDPNRIEVHLDIAFAESALGRHEDAVARVEGLAEAYMRGGLSEEAEELFRFVASWEPDGGPMLAERRVSGPIANAQPQAMPTTIDPQPSAAEPAWQPAEWSVPQSEEDVPTRMTDVPTRMTDVPTSAPQSALPQGWVLPAGSWGPGVPAPAAGERDTKPFYVARPGESTGEVPRLPALDPESSRATLLPIGAPAPAPPSEDPAFGRTLIPTTPRSADAWTPASQRITGMPRESDADKGVTEIDTHAPEPSRASWPTTTLVDTRSPEAAVAPVDAPPSLGAPSPMPADPSPAPWVAPAPQPVAPTPAPQPVAPDPSPQPVAQAPAPQPVAQAPAPSEPAEWPPPPPIGTRPKQRLRLPRPAAPAEPAQVKPQPVVQPQPVAHPQPSMHAQPSMHSQPVVHPQPSVHGPPQTSGQTLPPTMQAQPEPTTQPQLAAYPFAPPTDAADPWIHDPRAAPGGTVIARVPDGFFDYMNRLDGRGQPSAPDPDKPGFEPPSAPTLRPPGSSPSAATPIAARGPSAKVNVAGSPSAKVNVAGGSSANVDHDGVAPRSSAAAAARPSRDAVAKPTSGSKDAAGKSSTAGGWTLSSTNATRASVGSSKPAKAESRSQSASKPESSRKDKASTPARGSKAPAPGNASPLVARLRQRAGLDKAEERSRASKSKARGSSPIPTEPSDVEDQLTDPRRPAPGIPVPHTLTPDTDLLAVDEGVFDEMRDAIDPPEEAGEEETVARASMHDLEQTIARASLPDLDRTRAFMAPAQTPMEEAEHEQTIARASLDEVDRTVARPAPQADGRAAPPKSSDFDDEDATIMFRKDDDDR